MIANNIQSFTLRAHRAASTTSATMYLDDTTTQYIATAGFKWNLGDGPVQRTGKSTASTSTAAASASWDQFGLRVDRIFAAVDAVRDPATGQIVCRVSLYGNAAFPGCQPLDLFGRGQRFAGAVDYVIGNDPGSMFTTPLYFADVGYAGEPDL